jgi:DNA-binding beta-propeller fold protein YncE
VALIITIFAISFSVYSFTSTEASSGFSRSYFQAVAIPTALVPNSDSNKLYVIHDKDFISVMDIHSGKILGRIYFDENYKERLSPEVSLAVNAKTNTLYATVEYSDTLYVIDGEQDEVVSKINLDGIGYSIAVNSDTNRVYVTAGNNQLYVVDGSSEELIATIDTGDHSYLSGDVASFVPPELSINPKTNLIYATNAGHNLISVINGSTNAIRQHHRIQLSLFCSNQPQYRQTVHHGWGTG